MIQHRLILYFVYRFSKLFKFKNWIILAIVSYVGLYSVGVLSCVDGVCVFV